MLWWHASSACAMCGTQRLTIRSSGAPPAGHQAREAIMFIIVLAGLAPCRRRPLSSNVRQHREPDSMKCYSHQDSSAIGLCKTCFKALCADCEPPRILRRLLRLRMEPP